MAENDLSLLIKMMKMTTATEDPVALVALRKANDFIRNKLSSDWESILTGKVTIIEDPFKSIDIPDNKPKASDGFPTRPPPRPPAPPAKPATGWTPPPPPPRAPPQTPPQTAPRGPTTVTYCSLDAAGKVWALRSNNPLTIGQKISVTKKNGKVKTEFVGNLIKQSFGDFIYDIGQNPSTPKLDINKLF